jgi:site-specific DNA recombinase
VSTRPGGIAKCPCGNVVFGATTRTGAHGYRCRQTDKGHVVRGGREDIDALIADAIIGRLSMPDAVDLLREDKTPAVEALRARRHALAARIEALGRELADPDIPVGITKDAIRSARRDLDGVDEELKAATVPSVLAPLVGVQDVRAAWERLGIDAQRAVVATLVDVTLLAPKRGPRPFDPATVQIVLVEDRG